MKNKTPNTLFELIYTHRKRLDSLDLQIHQLLNILHEQFLTQHELNEKITKFMDGETEEICDPSEYYRDPESQIDGE